MKTSVHNVDEVTVKLSVEVEPARVKKAFDRAAREIARDVRLPGFRPGKAPRRLLEQRFGREVIAQQAMESSLTDYYVEALERESIEPIGPPELDMGAFDEQEGCTFEATVEIRPEFEVPDHEGISVTFPEWDVADEDVEEALEELRDRFAELDEVERPARRGDYVTIDLTVAIDGEELEEAGATDALYEVGSGGVTPRLDTELDGASAGDVLTYDDELPEDYPVHAGETASFTVTVQDVREKEPPDDDDLAEEQGFEDIDELRADVRRSLLRNRVVQARTEVRARVMEAYLARAEVPLPPSLVTAERDARVEQLERQAEQYGVDVERLLELEGTSRDEFESNAEDQARTAVKARLVLEALAERLELGVDADDLNAEVLRHAQRTGLPPEQIANLLRDQDTLGHLLGDILRRKAVDAIMEAATLDGGPSDEVLRELGLLAPEAAEAAEEDEPESGLIVPGASESRSEGGLIVPGRG